MTTGYSATEGGHVARQVKNPHEVNFWAANQRTGNVGIKATLAMLATHADELASCSPSQELLAEETDQSVSTVYRQIKQLETWGLVKVEARYVYEDGKKRRTSNRYFLQIDCEFNVKTHGKDYDAAIQGPPHLPVNLTGRSEALESVHLPVNLTGSSDQGKDDSVPEMSCSPTGHESSTYRSPVTDELTTKSFRTKNKSSLPPTEVESRAHAPAPTHERASVTPPESDEDRSMEESSTLSKIQPRESQKSQAAERRKQANALGQRWHDHCDQQGTPFPKSEPGVKHGKFAQFTTMLANVLISYEEGEIWNALVTIDRLHSDNFPSRKILDRELVAARRSKMRAENTQLAVVEGEPGIIAEIIDWHATRGPIDARGREQLAKTLAELIAAGAEPNAIGLALNKCAKPVPAIWELRNALWGASGDGKRSTEQTWRDEREEQRRKMYEWAAREDAREAREAAERAAELGGQSDSSKIVRGEVL